jgi:hypothetical protein
MEYFGNEVDGKDLGVIISTLDGCLPCMALLGCDCQKSAAQMLNEQLAGIGADEGDPNVKTIANVLGQTGATIFGSWQAAEAAKKIAAETASKADSIGQTAITVAGIVVAGVLGVAAFSYFGKKR